ncbi:MAG TPA: ABC transporter substrate-binding protein [bacterium]|nr:ABC transporter substrate-binding protein [bacterium]HPP29714.1 ABC transporter substrate-binding protein [bacterium]
MKNCVTFLLLIFFAGCHTSHIKKSPEDTLVLSTSSDPKSFNPIIAKETSTTAITQFIFEGLTSIDGVTLEVKPSLAKRWEVDSTGKVWRFFLRDDVKWNDGHHFTADDVVFTYKNLIYNPNIPTSSRDVLSIDGKPFKVRKIDRYTVEFVLPEKFAPFLQLMSQEILPAHKIATFIEKGIFTSWWGVNEKPENIVGTGPFMIKEYRPAEWIILEKNPYYWKKDNTGEQLPYLQRIVFLIISDTNMALLKFKTGEIDIIPVRGQDYPLLEPLQKEQNFTIYKLGPSLGSEFITLNQNIKSPLPDYKKVWFRNRNFRQAIAYAIDKENIIKNVYGGFAMPQEGPLNISCGFFYNPSVKKYPYNINKAEEILKKEGFYRENGFLFDKDHNPVEFTILTNSNNFERIQIASIIQDDLKKLGMKVNLLPVEFNTLVTKISITKDWESVIIGLTGGIEPHGGKNVWHTKGQLHLWNLEPDENNITEWERKVDAIFEEGAKELNLTRRKKLYDRWQQIVSEELPLIYTASPTVMTAVRNKFEGLKPSVYGGVLHNIEEIKIGRIKNYKKLK